MSTFPLTPGKALAVAAALEVHSQCGEHPMPHWLPIAEDLRTWAAAEFGAGDAPTEPGPDLEVPADAPSSGDIPAKANHADVTPMPVVDLVAALRGSIEAAKARRAAGGTR